MELRHFEQRIKNLFGSYRPEVDTDAIWENIEPHLKKKKKRRGFIWFFAGFGIALLMLFINNDQRSKGIQAPEVALDIKKNTEKSSIQKQGSRDKQYEVSVQAPQPFRTKPSAISIDEYLPANRPATGMVSAPEKLEPAGPVATQQTEKQYATTEFYLTLLPLIRNEGVASLDSVPKSKVLPIQEEEKKERLFSMEDPNDDSAKKRRKKHQKLKLQHEFSVSAGPGLGISHFGKGQATTEHLNGRKETEHILESYTGSMFYSVATQKGFVIKTGLQYRQINEKFHLDYIQQEVEYINGVLTRTVDQAGNLISQTTGNKPVIKTTVYSNTAFNHYYFLNVPFGIGRRVADRRTRREFSGGLDVNLFFRAHATIYNADNEPTTYRHGGSGYEDVFRHKTGWGIWGAYAYEWKMSDRLYWQLSGSLQIPFHPVSNTNNTVAQQYINLGAQIGGIYRLSKPKKSKSGIAAARAY